MWWGWGGGWQCWATTRIKDKQRRQCFITNSLQASSTFFFFYLFKLHFMKSAISIRLCLPIELDREFWNDRTCGESSTTGKLAGEIEGWTVKKWYAHIKACSSPLMVEADMPFGYLLVLPRGGIRELHTDTVPHRHLMSWHTDSRWTGLGSSRWCLASSIRGVTLLFLQVCVQQLSPHAYEGN